METSRVPPGAGVQGCLGDHTPSILLADDDPEQRAMVAEAFIEDGYEVVEASDGDEVLRLVEAAIIVPDVLLLDFCMPGYSGLGVLRILRGHGKAPPTLIVTGFNDSSVDRLAEQLGAVCVIHKPVNLDKLRERVRRVLSARSAPPQSAPPQSTPPQSAPPQSARPSRPSSSNFLVR